MTKDAMESRSPAESISEITEWMMPGHVNNVGNVFGGVVLSMVDRAAAVAAMRHSGSHCVTVSIDQVDFMEPIYAGDLVICRAVLNFVGRSSMEIGVGVEAENPITGERRVTNDCYLTFVAIDEDGRPIPVRPLDLTTDEERERFEAGKRRRALRRAVDGGGA